MPESPQADDSNVAEEVQDSDALAGAGGAKPPRKRARKSRSNGARPSGAGTVPKRKGKERQTPGSLSGLMNMPLDVFFQVAAHLHPLDMLNLARTSKLLRSIVLAKSSRSAWIASLATVDSLPSCPKNMSEPLHAALLFDQYCFLCGIDRARWVDYAIRLRLCKTCYKANILKGSAILGPDQVDFFQTLPLFSCETGSDYKKAQRFALQECRTAAQKYYAAHVHAMIDKYTSLQQKDGEAASHFVEETLLAVTVTHEYAVMILAWLKEKSLTKELTNMQITLDRKSKITERLQELGYTEDDFPEGEEAWDKLVDQPKVLTDRIWNNVRPKLEEQLAIEKDRRTQEAFEDRVDDRLEVIVQWYDEYIEENLTDIERSLMPNLCDARELPSLVALAQTNDAQGDVPREAFLALTEQMLADAEGYKARAKRELADVLCHHSLCRELKDIPAEDVLQRYCAYFECIWKCNPVVDGCAYLTFEQLHAHWREVHPDNPWLHGDEDYHWDRDDRVQVPTFWPWSEHSVPSVGKCALEAVGIPLDTPRSVLDGWTRDGRLFCACEHPGMPLPAQMSWGKLLFHLLQQTHEHSVRATEMKLLRGKHNPNHVLRDNHPLDAGDGCCLEFLPEGADTTPASMRTTISDSVRAQIEAKLATRQELGVAPVCRICKGLTRKTSWQVHRRLPVIRLPARAEEIVWHLQSCHGKEFEKRDILFVNI
ncbi:hypothetical protein LXA43DRAFT_595501 [Ganoderma leucocontextum]|nr:hypothetical protein LXA43DRAFT_595501 [Ganoderma leucocontextum]